MLIDQTETLSDGCLGSEIEEGRSEMRNALRIAEFRESIDFLTRIAALALQPMSHLLQSCTTYPSKDLSIHWRICRLAL